jgi:hypothetical protein
VVRGGAKGGMTLALVAGRRTTARFPLPLWSSQIADT